MILCKLTDQNIQTHKGFQWTPGEWAPELSGSGELCGPGFYHCYEHPLLAVLLNPIHADIKNPRLWLIETKGEYKNDHGLKHGYPQMRLTEELPLPDITTEQRVAFAIHCALAVCNDPKFTQWAEKWLSGEDRTEAEARTAERAALEARSEAAAVAVWAASWAVCGEDEWAEAWTARSVAHSAARSAAWSAQSAAWSAQSAAWSAPNDIDLIKLAELAMTEGNNV